MNSLPSELQRAQELSNRLANALRLANDFKLDKASLSKEDAEELIQLLEDSLKTAKQFGLYEFDGTIKPPRITRKCEDERSRNLRLQ